MSAFCPLYHDGKLWRCHDCTFTFAARADQKVRRRCKFVRDGWCTHLGASLGASTPDKRGCCGSSESTVFSCRLHALCAPAGGDVPDPAVHMCRYCKDYEAQT